MSKTILFLGLILSILSFSIAQEEGIPDDPEMQPDTRHIRPRGQWQPGQRGGQWQQGQQWQQWQQGQQGQRRMPGMNSGPSSGDIAVAVDATHIYVVKGMMLYKINKITMVVEKTLPLFPPKPEGNRMMEGNKMMDKGTNKIPEKK